MAQNNKNFTVKNIADWLKISVKEMMAGQDGTYFFKLADDAFGRTWAIVLGWTNTGNDEPDEGEYCDPKSPKWRIATKIGFNNSYMKCDYDMDWLQPWDSKTGDVDDDDSTIGRCTTDKDWHTLAANLKRSAYRKYRDWKGTECR